MATGMTPCYASDTESSSTEDGNSDFSYKPRKISKKNFENVPDYPYRNKKCSTRNAILARENRIKKKLYVEKLEQEVKVLRRNHSKLNSIIEDQSVKISSLQKEVAYLKSVLANSADLRVLIKNIQCSTGMSVTTSLDNSLPLNNDFATKRKIAIARKTAHPWNDYLSTSGDGAETDCEVVSHVENFLDIDVVNQDPFIDSLFDMDTLGCNSVLNILGESVGDTYNEHNYTLTSKYPNVQDEDDVGVCLNVSKHRVSLEFCSSCSENAVKARKAVE